MPQVQEFRKIVINQQFDLPSFTDTAGQYEKAKARLLAAQEEKMEATAELMALRTSLSAFMETVWPEPEIFLETERETEM